MVGGNVSLYNEGGEGPIYPTPVVGMVGKLPEPSAVPRTGFAEEGHAIALVGMFEPALEGSELEKLRGSLARSLPPLDLAAHADALVRVTGGGAERRRFPRRTTSPTAGSSARSPSAASRAGWAPGSRWTPATPPLFGEGPGGVVVAGPREAVEALGGATVIGRGARRRADDRGRAELPVADLREAYEGAIPAAFAA